MSDQLSSCGLSCLVSALPSTNCGSILNTTCLCPDQAFDALVSNCVVSKCSIGEQLSLKIFTSRSCNATVLDRSGQIGILQGILTPIQDILFFFRIANKLLNVSTWGADDTAIVIAWILQNGFLGGGIVASRLGIGRDVWGLDEDRIIKIIQVFLAFGIAYVVTLGIIKMSICFFYMRLFPDKVVRRYLWATQIFNILLVSSFVIVDFAQCIPLSWFWNRLDQNTTETGKCININALSWVHGGINIALDVWMLALPATQILSLQMALARKIHVLAMFALGAFLTLVSCIRLKSLIAFARTQNPTQDFYDVALWSAIELTTGVVVACLPALRQTLVRYIPTLRTVVTKYASRMTGADQTARSNVKSQHIDSRGNANLTSRQRKSHKRSSDEIPMSNLSHQHLDYAARSASRDELSRSGSCTPRSLVASADIKGYQDPVYVKADLGNKAETRNVDHEA